ncbi:MAG: hypothetical protein AAGF47_00150 [Planctomycetota bacterium]
MKRFRFKLDPVLRQREQAERSAQHKAAAVERQRIEVEAALSAEQRSIEAERDAFATLGRGGAASDSFRCQAVALAAARARAQALAVELAGVLKQAERARQELAQAAAARRAMELLRDRRLDAFRRGIQHAEAIADDDLTTMRHARGGQPGRDRAREAG